MPLFLERLQLPCTCSRSCGHLGQEKKMSAYLKGIALRQTYGLGSLDSLAIIGECCHHAHHMYQEAPTGAMSLKRMRNKVHALFLHCPQGIVYIQKLVRIIYLILKIRQSLIMFTMPTGMLMGFPSR